MVKENSMSDLERAQENYRNLRLVAMVLSKPYAQVEPKHLDAECNVLARVCNRSVLNGKNGYESVYRTKGSRVHEVIKKELPSARLCEELEHARAAKTLYAAALNLRADHSEHFGVRQYAADDSSPIETWIADIEDALRYDASRRILSPDVRESIEERVAIMAEGNGFDPASYRRK